MLPNFVSTLPPPELVILWFGDSLLAMGLVYCRPASSRITGIHNNVQHQYPPDPSSWPVSKRTTAPYVVRVRCSQYIPHDAAVQQEGPRMGF
ncbi:hypothetical protein LXA43DRAFT_1027815 [Ganoderma leucocontextum]|nr:hypothetical protein LXA43DRAFT_1027815 [Ganoderma leucocontextum]